MSNNKVELDLLKKVLRKKYEEVVENSSLKKLSKVDQEVFIRVSIDDYIKKNIKKQDESIVDIPKFLRDRRKHAKLHTTVNKEKKNIFKRLLKWKREKFK